MITDYQRPHLPNDADQQITAARPDADQPTPTRSRRMARPPQEPAAGDDFASTSRTGGTAKQEAAPGKASKLDQMAALLHTKEGVSIAELMTATGWQAHSVRGALAGSLKKRGLVITSERIEGVRRYRTELAA